jgi:hypothetical protein
MMTGVSARAVRIAGFARRMLLPLAAAVIVLIMADAHIWWFTSIENLLGCGQDALWCSDRRSPGVSVTALRSLKLVVKQDTPVTIGREELAQPEREDFAEQHHVEFSMTGPGIEGVQIKNIAHRRRLGLTYISSRGDEVEVLADRWYLTNDDVVRVGSSRLQVGDTGGGAIDFSIGNSAATRFVRFDSKALQVGGNAARLAAMEKCRAFRKVDQLLQFTSRWIDPLELLSTTPFVGPRISERPIRLSLGGSVDCYGPIASHLRLDAVRVDSVLLERGKDGRFFLTAGSPPGGHMPPVTFSRSKQPTVLGFSGIAWGLKNQTFGVLSSLVVGRTTYTISARDLGTGGVELTLRPVLKVSYFNPTPATSPATQVKPRSSPSRGDVPEFVQRPGGPERLMTSYHPLRGVSISRFLLADFADDGPGISPTTLSGKLQRREIYLYVGLSIAPLLLWIILRGIHTSRAAWRWFRGQAAGAGDVELLRGTVRSALAFSGLVVASSLSLAPVALAVMKIDLKIDELMAVTIANWMLASVGIVLLSRGGWILNGIWLCCVLLAAIGSIFLLALAVDGNSSYWSSFFLKNKFLFLDTLPPSVWAAATIEPRLLRPWIQKLIGVGVPSVWLKIVRWAPVLALFAAMIFWLFFGGQAGVEGFNPVEFGKFASIVILSAFLVGLDPSRLHEFGDAPSALISRILRWILFVVLMVGSIILVLWVTQPLIRRLQDTLGSTPVIIMLLNFLCLSIVTCMAFLGLRKLLGRDVISTSLGFLLVLATASLFAVPAAQSDWSPVLIILALGAVVFACYCFASALRWLQFAWSYARRRSALPARFLPLPALDGAEILAVLVAALVVAVLYVSMRPNWVILFAVFAGLSWCLLRTGYRVLGEYAISNGLILAALPIILGVLLAVQSQSASYVLPLAIGGTGLLVTFGSARLSGRLIRAPRWNRLVAIWPIAGVLVLVFAANYGIEYSLKFIGIPEWNSNWSQQTAMENLKKDYASSMRPAIVGRFISWADTRLDETGVVRYWDLGLQVIRSRAVIAAAPCGIRQEVVPVEPTARDVVSKVADFGYGLVSMFRATAPAEARPCGSLARSPGPDAPDTPLQRILFDGSDPLRVPVVQFDFPAAFLIGRFGLGFAGLLICVQSALLLLGAVGFLQILSNDAGSEIDARARRFLSIVLFGSITLFALHWTISWSNALGLFPVMGQPMSWLSAGVSHQILMVFPCVITMIVALRYGRFVALALRYRMPPR